jgi:hypothetical protein
MSSDRVKEICRRLREQVAQLTVEAQDSREVRDALAARIEDQRKSLAVVGAVHQQQYGRWIEVHSKTPTSCDFLYNNH